MIASAWALASVAVALAAGVVRSIVIVRFLEPSEMGVMAVALLALGFVEAVASTGVDTALIAERKDVERYFDPAFTIQVTRGFMVFGLLWVAAPGVAYLFHVAEATAVIRAVGAIAALRGFANPAVAVAMQRLEFRRAFWWSLPEILGSLGLAIVLVQARRDVWALVIAAVIGQGIATLCSYGLVPRVPRLIVTRERIHELLRFGRFVSGARALMYFSVNLDAAVVGLAMGTHPLGLYQFATRIAELPVVTFTRAIAQVALPTLSGLQGRVDAARRTWHAMLGLVVAVNGVAALVIVLFAPWGIRVVAGEQWLEVVPLMRILALAMWARAVIVLTGQMLDGFRQPEVTLRLNAFRLAALVVLLPAFAAMSSVQGVAQAVLVVNGGSALLAIRLAARALPTGPLDPSVYGRT